VYSIETITQYVHPQLLPLLTSQIRENTPPTAAVADFKRPAPPIEVGSAGLRVRPESFLRQAKKRFRLVNQARMITARIKGGKTAALKRLAKNHGISLFTLNRYIKASNRALKTSRRDKENSIAAQLVALTPAYGKNAGKTRAWSPEALEYAKSIYGPEGFTRQTEVYRQTVSKAKEKGWKEGSYDSLRRFLMKAVDQKTISKALKRGQDLLRWARRESSREKTRK
jgi:hypothetical protein